MKVAIHQPHYLPWLGYLAKWAAADLFVFLDTVQYEKNGWQNRNRIKAGDGWQWLTVPIRAGLGTALADVAVDIEQPWARRHLRAIEHAYARTPGLGRHAAVLDGLYGQTWTHLTPLAVTSATWLARALDIAVPACLASDLSVKADDPTGRLVAICQAVGATTYLAGAGGLDYMDLEQFAAARIEIRVQRYDHPEYRQIGGKFVPFLSALDVLLTHGNDAPGVLRRGDGWSCPLDRP